MVGKSINPQHARLVTLIKAIRLKLFLKRIENLKVTNQNVIILEIDNNGHMNTGCGYMYIGVCI